jgi:uncharacterized repeat protein (TIGR01451 family)
MKVILPCLILLVNAVFGHLMARPAYSTSTGEMRTFSPTAPLTTLNQDNPTFTEQVPNDKTVTPNIIAPGMQTEVRYTIRFQNTGTDTAYSVVIYDTLSSALEVTSIGQFSTSHPGTMRILPGNILEARFDNIMLPDSNVNEPASHGTFSFTISAKPDMIEGAVIHNRAMIYFDYTNWVLTKDAPVNTRSTTALRNIAGNSGAWTPNPTNGPAQIILTKAPTGILSALDAAGRATSIPYTYSNQTLYANLSTLPAGIYLIRQENGGTLGRVSVLR